MLKTMRNKDKLSYLSDQDWEILSSRDYKNGNYGDLKWHLVSTDGSSETRRYKCQSGCKPVFDPF